MQVRFRRVILSGEEVPIHPPALLSVIRGDLADLSITFSPRDEHSQQLWDAFEATDATALRLEGSMDPSLASRWEGRAFIADLGPPVRLSISEVIDTDLKP